MYSYVSSVAKTTTPYSRWKEYDLASTVLSDLYADYTQVYLVLSNPVLLTNVTLDMNKMRSSLSSSSQTVEQWLVSNGNGALPTVAKLPEIELREVRYNDAAHAGYKIWPVKPSAQIDPDDLDDKPWAKLTCEAREINYSQMHKSVLVSVNGYYHPTDFDNEGLFVVDAGKSLARSGLNHIGITSFNGVGQLTHIPLKADMIYRADPDMPMKHGFDINLKKSHKGKSIILVLGGYMFLANEKFVFRTSNTTIHVKFDCFDFPQRFLESNHYLDLSDLPLEGAFADDKTDHDVMVELERLMSDEVITAYATLPQSFVVLVDKPDLSVEFTQVERPNFNCAYLTHVRPVYPLQVGMGRLGNYWPVLEKSNWYDVHPDKYALNLYDTQYNRYQFETTRPEDLTLIDDAREPDMPLFPSSYSYARFIQIAISSVKLVNP